MRKNLTVAKTFKKIAKLREKNVKLTRTIDVLGNTSIRGKKLNSLDTNRIMYELATYRAMYKECVLLVPEGPYRDEILIEALDVDIKVKLTTMEDYVVVRTEHVENQKRLDKLNTYLSLLPDEEKKAYKLEKAANAIDPRDNDDE